MFLLLATVLISVQSVTGGTSSQQVTDVINNSELKLSKCILSDIPTWLMNSIIENIAEPILDIVKNSTLVSSTVHDSGVKDAESFGSIYFKARLSGGTTVGLNSNVRFNQVVFNNGNHYNPTSGVFTAPVTGLYQFMVHVQSKTTGSSAFTLVNQGELDIYTSILSAWDTASFTTILQVQKGDHVSVRKTGDSSNAQMASSTHFAGYLLRIE